MPYPSSPRPRSPRRSSSSPASTTSTRPPAGRSGAATCCSRSRLSRAPSTTTRPERRARRPHRRLLLRRLQRRGHARHATRTTTDASPSTSTWTDGSTTRKVRQEAVINNPGAALAPGIRTLTRTSPTADPITTNVAAVTFQATTTSVPAGVKWSVDNVPQGDATGSNFTWNFTWNISAVDDGTYLVGARAFDKFGESGTTRTRTVVLNRFAPRTPTGFVAGRNGAIGVEFEWNPNTEPDVSGYRVYRVAGAAPERRRHAGLLHAHDRPSADELPRQGRSTRRPRHSTTTSSPWRRRVAGHGRGGEPAARASTRRMWSRTATYRPNPPDGLTATSPGDGTVVLTWSDPVSPPAGEPATRSATTGSIATARPMATATTARARATEHVFVDADPGPGTHTLLRHHGGQPARRVGPRHHRGRRPMSSSAARTGSASSSCCSP